MAVLVVDRLEAVEVDEDDRPVGLGSPARDVRLESLHDRCAVVATGELVERRPRLELLPHASAVRYVRHACDRPVDRAVLLTEGAEADRAEAQLGAVRWAQTDLDVGRQA